MFKLFLFYYFRQLEEKCSIMESELENFHMKNKNDSIDKNSSAENVENMEGPPLKKRTFDDKMSLPLRLNFKSELVPKVFSIVVTFP